MYLHKKEKYVKSRLALLLIIALRCYVTFNKALRECRKTEFFKRIYGLVKLSFFGKHLKFYSTVRQI